MILETLYQNYSADTPEGENARILLRQTHWYSSICEFDPRTADALPETLSTVLKKIANPVATTVLKDRLWCITEHVRNSLEVLFKNLNESPRREQAILPLHAVRELDTASFMALARRPGRNVREKLAEKPYLQAVRHFQSIDLPENRLLKAFSQRLAELLELRAKYLGEEPDELLALIYSWLETDEVQSIRRWDNLPPNNTLLSHRHYRAVYDAWSWLQMLDDDISNDLKDLENRNKTIQQWDDYGHKYESKNFIFAEMPILFDYDKFGIFPWVSTLLFEKYKMFRPVGIFEVKQPVCIDLTELHPIYSVQADNPKSQKLTYSFIWQKWSKNEFEEEISLFNADAVYLHPDTTTISTTDLFFSRNHTHEHLDSAANAFITKLRQTFTNDTLIWLQPDFLNDFELEITRRNINARFPDAEPLPRSIAAVFEQVDFGRLREHFAVIVIDTVGGKQCATKLEARVNEELKKRLPETCGFYWERHPSVILSNENSRAKNDDKKEMQMPYDIVFVDAQGIWHEVQRPKTAKFVPKNVLRQDKRFGYFDSLINLSQSPVRGGIQYHTLQKRAGDIPLWCDQIPELSIKILAFGRYQRISLVSRGTTVKPLRGQAVQIPVKEIFTLLMGKPHYQFPLFIGNDEESSGFSAKLESPAFPLPHDLECHLNLTFTYGADDPYCLIFEPIDHSIPPIRVKWKRTVEEIITDAPAPKYPKPMTWEELQRDPKPDSDETSDLLEWALTAIWNFDKMLNRTTGIIKRNWRTDKNGFHFTLVQCNDVPVDIFIHENNFVNGNDYSNFQAGDVVSFELQIRDEQYYVRKVSNPNYKEEKGLRTFDEEFVEDVIERIHKVLYFPVIQIWREGRSIYDEACPPDFNISMTEDISYLNELLLQTEMPSMVKTEILFLLSCMHKDAPDECIRWITEQVKNDRIQDPQAVGFALGDVSEAWQRSIFDQLVSRSNNSALSVFSYAIWREQHFVEKFSFSEYQSILNSLISMLANIKPYQLCKNENDKWTLRNWVRATVEPLELLLGLLRTRASANEEIKMLLQPHQKLTKKLAKQVEHVTEVVVNSHVTLFSRVQLGNLPSKPEGDHTPDLLYALRLYLTNDVGANTIQITGVVDEENQ